jgi:NAD(P)-dependent dehydrogenase (short-subunit alcohol dehydrogenase family)
MKKRFSLDGKVAIVTGACGLLGRHHCEALAEAGAHVVAADLLQADCEEIALSLETDSIGLRLDVTDQNSIRDVLARILARYNTVDILVNNAAVNDKFEDPSDLDTSRFEYYPMELWQRSLHVNVTGTFLCCQIIGSEMASRRNGNIINIASTYGIVAPDQSIYRDRAGQQRFFKSAAYPVTKGAVISLTRFLAAYWGSVGVRVNCLSPGGVESRQDDFFVENYSQRTPLGRMAQPGDYRGAITFLASDESSYMTGANLVVDGGWTVW